MSSYDYVRMILRLREVMSETDYTSNHHNSMSNSNQGFSCTGEEEEESFVEPSRVLGRARALVDCTPSPYDKDGLAFKKGDIIDILAKSSSGYWVGRLRSQVGHFKFINVQEIQNGEKKNLQKRLSVTEQNAMVAKTLEDLLVHLGLETYLNVLVLNGYHNLETLKGLEEQDLIALGIVNVEHRVQLLEAIDRLEGINTSLGISETSETSINRQASKAIKDFCPNFETFSSNRKNSDPYLSDSYKCQLQNSTKSFNPLIENTVLDSRINNLDYNLTPLCNGMGLEDLALRGDLNIPSSIPHEKVYFYSDLQTNQKVRYSYGRGISAYAEQLYFSRAGLVIDSPDRDHFLTQMNCLGKVPEFPQGSSDFNHLNGSIYPNCGSYITKEEKYMMEASRRKLKEKIRAYALSQEAKRNDFDYNGHMLSTEGRLDLLQNSSTSGLPNQEKALTLPRKKKNYVNNDLSLFKSSDPSDAYKSERKSKKNRRKKDRMQPLIQYPEPPILLCDLVARKLQEENIDLCQEPYTDKTGFCGIPPALVQRYADELQQDIYDIAEALDKERIRVLQLRGRTGVPNDFLADSCCEPVVEANYSNLSNWLISLGLPIYEKVLHKHGCTELYHMTGLKDTDFQNFGIENVKHIRLLRTAIEALHIQIDHSQYTT